MDASFGVRAGLDLTRIVFFVAIGSLGDAKGVRRRPEAFAGASIQTPIVWCRSL
jgi:hypothetical protein